MSGTDNTALRWAISSWLNGTAAPEAVDMFVRDRLLVAPFGLPLEHNRAPTGGGNVSYSAGDQITLIPKNTTAVRKYFSAPNEDNTATPPHPSGQCRPASDDHVFLCIGIEAELWLSDAGDPAVPLTQLQAQVIGDWIPSLSIEVNKPEDGEEWLIPAEVCTQVSLGYGNVTDNLSATQAFEPRNSKLSGGFFMFPGVQAYRTPWRFRFHVGQAISFPTDWNVSFRARMHGVLVKGDVNKVRQVLEKERVGSICQGHFKPATGAPERLLTARVLTAPLAASQLNLNKAQVAG